MREKEGVEKRVREKETDREIGETIERERKKERCTSVKQKKKERER